MSCSADETESQLIFFDTFTRDTSDSAAFDLIQFQLPVRISEIRIIPLGARVEANFPNGDRLGATNPSSFLTKFYVNDLSKPSNSTFTSIGDMDYRQNENIVLKLRDRVPTDGLLIRGPYTILSIAVLGYPTDLKTDVKNSVSSPEESVASTLQSDPGSTVCPQPVLELEPDENGAESPDDLSGSPLSGSNLPDESNDTGHVSPLNPDLLENISPDASPSPIDTDAASPISDGEFPAFGADGGGEDNGLEEISSDEDDFNNEVEANHDISTLDIVTHPDSKTNTLL